MNIELKRGATRAVLLIGPYAFKFPRLRYWRLFLWGLLGNMQERTFSGLHPNLCPVLWSVPGGWLVVMPRTEPLDYMEWELFDYHNFVNLPDMKLPVEQKMCSFGWYKDRIVAVDYGS